MPELDSIRAEMKGPNTVDSLCGDLRRFGITEGMTVLLHSSLSAIGWVCGGAVGVILAVEKALGESGTLVMPAFSGGLSEPCNWRCPPVPEAWHEIIRAQMPPFDRDLTPVGREIGVIAETFRKQSGVVRSGHPSASFAAWGRHKTFVTEGPAGPDFPFGENGPLARLYELDARVLLLGVGYDRCTSLHLAECRADYRGKLIISEGAPMIENGSRVWREYKDVALRGDAFDAIGKASETERALSLAKVGLADARLIPQRELVDYAVKWMEVNRS